MKLSELFDAVKACKSDPELLVQFGNRPASYPITDLRFLTTIRAATLEDFRVQVEQGKAGPARLVLIGEIPE